MDINWSFKTIINFIATGKTMRIKYVPAGLLLSSGVKLWGAELVFIAIVVVRAGLALGSDVPPCMFSVDALREAESVIMFERAPVLFGSWTGWPL